MNTSETLADRYELGRLLGSGASGLVYEAFDRQRGTRVALKRLRRDGPLDVARLKREFRTLQDVHHDNLVRLLELEQVGDETLLAMDLVDGQTLLRYVRGADDATPAPVGVTTTWSTMLETPIGADRDVEPRAVVQLDPARISRLRTALAGLAAGLSALHAGGLLHRDVKPGNVLVTDEGRVVLLDFGLATRESASASEFAGTVSYMAPEQITSDPLTPATDWYAVGCVLFEALVGRPPFEGPPSAVLYAKRVDPAPDVRLLAPDAPDDLLELCRALLLRDPSARPDGRSVCAALGALVEVAPEVAPFVGRAAELGALRAAWAAPGLRVAHVRGPSGLGKTRLVERFLEERGDALVLAARCYERERAPFKAVDPLVDALAEALTRREPRSLDAIVPEGIGAAARLFPALARVPGVRPGAVGADPVVERRRAVEALRELLRRLASEQPTVLWIDDLQWGDLDSANLLASLLRRPDAPPVLVVLGSRSDDPHVDEILAPLSELAATRVDLAPLTEADSRSLVAGQVGAASEALVARVVAEAGGSPFFLGEIARWLASGEAAGGSLIAGVVGARVEALPPAARGVLETVAVAGRPIAPELALRAAQQVEAGTGLGEVALLTARRLLATRRGRSLECTHDRIRETVVAGLPRDAFAARHRALAVAMGPEGDPDQLSEHWEHAGERALAAETAVRAARAAEQALAFEKAVGAWRRALRLAEVGVPGRRALELGLGRALAKGGHAEAADIFLAAAASGPAEERAALERDAAHMLLRCGHFERAYALLPRVVAAVGMGWPRSRATALAEVIWRAARPAWLTSRRHRDGDRAALELSMELAMSLSYADMLQAAVFSSRAIDLAERIAEPETVSVARAMRGSNSALLADFDASARWVASAREALPVDAPEALRASVDMHESITDCVRGRFDQARPKLTRAIGAFERAGGMPYETGMALTFLTFAAVQLGDLGTYRALRSRVIDDARARGDKHQEVLFRVAYSLAPALLDDDPDAELQNLHEARDVWGEGLSTVWLFGECARAQLDQYCGRPADALARIREVTPRAERAGSMRVVLNALRVLIVRASAAAALAGSDPSARRDLEGAVRALRKLGTAPARYQAEVWQARIDVLDGRPQAAVASYDRALESLREAPCPWQDEMVQMARARLVGEDPSPWFEALRSRGIARPEVMTKLYVDPGPGPA